MINLTGSYDLEDGIDVTYLRPPLDNLRSTADTLGLKPQGCIILLVIPAE